MAVKNICNCPNPPGGRAVCEPHQLAICRYDGSGVPEPICIDPPPNYDRIPVHLFISNWTLSVVTASPRPLDQELSQRDLMILNSGSYRDEQTGAVTNFRLPVTMRDEELAGVSR